VKLLVISGWFPYPPICGAKIRTHNLIRQLSKFADIDLISLVQTLDSDQLAEGMHYLQDYCQSVQAVPAIPYDSSTLVIQKLLCPQPDLIRVTRNAELERRVTEIWHGSGYDAAIVTECGSPGVATLAAVSQNIRPLVVDSVELGVFRPQGSLLSRQRLRRSLTWVKTRRFSGALLRMADIFTVTSQQEYTLFRSIVPKEAPCVIVPNVVDLSDYDGAFGERDRKSLIHCGSFSYPVNYDAVLWFAQHVFGRIEMRDSIKFRATGRTAGRDLGPIQAACPQVEFTGLVKNIQPYIAQSGISIVPVLVGGSTRLKIPESMALGTPVVSTSLGAEGLDVRHEENILIADTPADFARQIDRLIQDDELWHRLSMQGRQLVERRYSAEAMGRQFAELFSRLLDRSVESILITPNAATETGCG
jgi:glycosyltransferase involved in cell wall biosynthesis